jgi:hypothetical protein
MNLFFDTEIREVPEVLNYRMETYTLILIAILSLSFIMIALSRMSNGRSLKTVTGIFFGNTAVEQVLKENMRLGSLSSILLILNYFISFSLSIFIFLNRIIIIEAVWSLLFAIGIPIIWFLMETAGLFMVGWLTGEQKKIIPAVLNTLTGDQFIGLLLSVLCLFWIMNPELNRIFLVFFISLICLKFVTRLLKNSIAVLSAGVTWYYLILYFCTLEILPLFVAYYYVMKNFLE